MVEGGQVLQGRPVAELVLVLTSLDSLTVADFFKSPFADFQRKHFFKGKNDFTFLPFLGKS